MKIAYVRVSTVDQNSNRQVIEADKTYEDKATGSNTDRPQLQEMLRNLQEGDEVHVWSIDRLARSIIDMHDLIKKITESGCSVHFIKEGLVFTPEKVNPINDLILNVLSSVYQFEVAISKQRQREGIEKAKADGKYKGRSTALQESPKVIQLLKKGVSQRNIAKEVGISLSSVQRIVKEYKRGK